MDENFTESMFLPDFQYREFCFICIRSRHWGRFESGERMMTICLRKAPHWQGHTVAVLGPDGRKGADPQRRRTRKIPARVGMTRKGRQKRVSPADCALSMFFGNKTKGHQAENKYRNL
jgi:hypothetical protein